MSDGPDGHVGAEGPGSGRPTIVKKSVPGPQARRILRNVEYITFVIRLQLELESQFLEVYYALDVPCLVI